MKSTTTRIRSAPAPTGGSLSSPANTAVSLPSLQITNPRPTYQSQNVQPLTRALRVASRSSSLLTKFCGSAPNCTVRLLIHTKSVHTDTVFVMTLGIHTDHLGLTSNVSSYPYSRQDRTFILNRTSRRIGKWKPYRSTAHRNYGSSLEPSGSAHVQTAYAIEACRPLYIDRSAGYMERIGDTSVCHLSLPRLSQRRVALRSRSPRA